MDSNIKAYLDLGIEYAITYGLKLIFFLILLFVTFKVAGWVNRMIRRIVDKKELDPALGHFFANIAKYCVLVLGVVTSLGTVGIETASFAAVLAATGFAVGMALQGTLGHFASGVMLLLFRPFKVGDFVTVGGQSGTVKAIDLFSTVLDTADNKRITMPNGMVYGNQIENASFHDIRRVDVAVGTAYEADNDKTREVLMRAIKSEPLVLDEPEPAVTLNALGASSIDWTMKAWVKKEDYWPVRDSLTRAAKYELDKEDIGIPYPQMELSIQSGSASALPPQSPTPSH